MRIEDPNEADTVEEGRDELMEEDETDTVVVKKRNKCFLQVRQSQYVLPASGMLKDCQLMVQVRT